MAGPYYRYWLVGGAFTKEEWRSGACATVEAGRAALGYALIDSRRARLDHCHLAAKSRSTRRSKRDSLN